MNDLVTHRITSEVVETISRTMPRDQIIWVDLLQAGDDLVDVSVVQRWNDMEAADDGVHLLDSGRGLRLPDRVDDAAMAAGSQNDQPFAFHDEIGADLVLKIIRDEGTGIF